jgi:hypothetical protein
MQEARHAEKLPGGTASELQYYCHPFTDTYYAAYSRDRVRVRRGDEWGEFNRDGHWLEGTIRFADPTFCRWVTGEYRYNQSLMGAKEKVWPLTRMGRARNIA